MQDEHNLRTTIRESILFFIGAVRPVEDFLKIIEPGATLEAMGCRQADCQTIATELQVALGIDIPPFAVNRSDTIEQVTESLLPLLTIKLS